MDAHSLVAGQVPTGVSSTMGTMDLLMRLRLCILILHSRRLSDPCQTLHLDLPKQCLQKGSNTVGNITLLTIHKTVLDRPFQIILQLVFPYLARHLLLVAQQDHGM